jgi:transcriptional regulator with XRE-family HTH domain
MPWIDSVSLGKALRLLRARHSRRQNEVAASAGLTKAMLSSYETGVRLPSLPSLGAILAAFGDDFHDLQKALDEVSDTP